MPRIWSQTVEKHRRDVRQAILDHTAQLARARGLHAVTMSQIAKEVGIGRATLYKYFNGVDDIIVAWHHRQVAEHIKRLDEAVSTSHTHVGRLVTAIRSHAETLNRNHDPSMPMPLLDLHSSRSANEASLSANDRVLVLVTNLIRNAAKAGEVRTDIPPEELAIFVLRGLEAASELDSNAAVNRLVNLVASAIVSKRD